MYIKRVKLTNIRCFEKLEIDFDRPGSSVLLLGDNGDGKSTILKSIAIGLCDEGSAAAGKQSQTEESMFAVSA